MSPTSVERLLCQIENDREEIIAFEQALIRCPSETGQEKACQEYLAKGALVMVEGRLQLDQWQAENGEKRSRLRVRADRVQFLGKPGKGRPAGGADAKAAPDGVEAAEPAEVGDRDEKVPF